MSKILFTNDMIEKYKEMAAKGFSYKEVANELGVTSNQVMGLAGRIKVYCKPENLKYVIGDKIGHITIIDIYTKNNKRWYKCKCECGKIIDRDNRFFKNIDNLSCGCMRLYGNLIGKQFGEWTVIDFGNNNKGTKWLCECSCGIIREVPQTRLTNGKSQSCGCIPREKAKITQINNKKKNIYVFKDDYIIGYTSNSNEEFYIDNEDFDKIKEYTWRTDNNGYIVTSIKIPKRTDISIHRVITDVPEELVVDHINHNTRDNRKSNLRICTVQENVWNSSISKKNTSGYTGVYYINKKWVSVITVNGNLIRLGYFDNYEDAVQTRQQAEKKYYGEYAYINSQELSPTPIINQIGG